MAWHNAADLKKARTKLFQNLDSDVLGTDLGLLTNWRIEARWIFNAIAMFPIVHAEAHETVPSLQDWLYVNGFASA